MNGAYNVVLADPPWSFRDHGSRMAPSYAGSGRANAHYDQVDNQRVKEMGNFIRDLAAPDSFLFLWAPNAIVLEGTATEVARRWGYEPKQLVTWVKVARNGQPRMGGGHFTRVCTESLILATRGRPRVIDRGVPGVIIAPRGEHSAKPDDSYRLIERLARGPFVELFARRRWNENWSALGDQVGERVNLLSPNLTSAARKRA